MKNKQNDKPKWENIFPELEIYEIESNNLDEFGDKTIESSYKEDFFTTANLGLTADWQKWNSWANLTTNGLPSLTASDIYSIDFANIGNITTINLSAINTSSSNAIWTGASAAGIYSNSNSVHISGSGSVQIPEGGDLIMGNVSLKDRLDKIESRLAILNPRPEIEKEFEELKALGDQYRALEQEIQERLKTFETLKRE